MGKAELKVHPAQHVWLRFLQEAGNQPVPMIHRKNKLLLHSLRKRTHNDFKRLFRNQGQDAKIEHIAYRGA
ncbi:hypothetical protein D3C73_1523200 [compost metagenome]